MVLWSVVRSRFDSREPFAATCAGLGRLTIGCGAMAVMARTARGDWAFRVPAMLRDICVPRLPSTAPSRSAVSWHHSTAVSGTVIVAHRGAQGNSVGQISWPFVQIS